MTREEQIRNAANEHFAHSWSGSVKDAFAEGAEWADKHPKDNLVDIDKVCERLENYFAPDGSIVPENIGLLQDLKRAIKRE